MQPVFRGADRKGLVLRCLRAAMGYWRGPTAMLAWPLLGLATLAMVLQLVVQYRLNFWSRDLFNAFEQKNGEALLSLTVVFLPLATASVGLALTAAWSRMTVDREWRRWFSQYLFEAWVSNDGHERLKHVAGEHQTPEYRIADDARITTDLPVDLLLGFCSSILTASTFISILSSAGGSLPITLWRTELVVGNYLVLAALLYSVLLTSAMAFIARRLAFVSEATKSSEADLRAAGSELRALGESRSSRQQLQETCRMVDASIARVASCWRDLCFQVMRMTFISHINLLIAPSVGLLLCSPKYLSGEMTLGAVVQAAAAFVAVQGAFNWFADNYGRLIEWLTSASRVGSLLESLDRLNAGKLEFVSLDAQMEKRAAR